MTIKPMIELPESVSNTLTVTPSQSRPSTPEYKKNISLTSNDIKEIKSISNKVSNQVENFDKKNFETNLVNVVQFTNGLDSLIKQGKIPDLEHENESGSEPESEPETESVNKELV